MSKRYSATSVVRQFAQVNASATTVEQGCHEYPALFDETQKNMSKSLIALDE
jgi:hypothetical protein